MRVFVSPASPYARKVMIVLHETGLLARTEVVIGSGTPLDPTNAPLVQNPLGKVPALERDDGPALYDSRVICQFLDHLGDGRLYPAPPRRWEVLTLEATGDGILDAALSMVYEGRIRPPELQMPAWVEGQWAKIARALDVLEARWMAHLAGPLDMGQIAVAAALGYLDLRHGARNWRAGHPALATWFAQISERPSLLATAPPT